MWRGAGAGEGPSAFCAKPAMSPPTAPVLFFLSLEDTAPGGFAGKRRQSYCGGQAAMEMAEAKPRFGETEPLPNAQLEFTGMVAMMLVYSKT
jgi:hypothetical protein